MPLARLAHRAMLPLALAVAALLSGPLPAQIRLIDPSSPDVAAARAGETPQPEDAPAPTAPVDSTPAAAAPSAPAPSPAPAAPAAGEARTGLPSEQTFREEEIFGAAERTFGQGTQGLAKFIEGILEKQGRPTAYIGGRDAGGAIALGLRYGEGTLFHKVEGEQPIYWQAPSFGFDLGGQGSKVLILVYNLYDSEELFRRIPMVEGNLYAIGGFTASYLRRGDIALVPIRLGVGWRFGASVGYMNFSHKPRIIP